MSLTLYFHPLSSFCHKALIALYELDIEFEKRVIDLGNDAIGPNFKRCGRSASSRCFATTPGKRMCRNQV